jgi:two-component system, OmpR family, response regulator
MTVSIVHAARAQTASKEVAERLREEGFDAKPTLIARSLIDAIATDQPDAVLIVCTGAAFDVVRLCRDVSSSVGCGVIVLTPGEPAVTFDQRLVIDVLDAGATEIVDIATAGPLLAAHVRAAIRARPKRVRQVLPVTLGDLVIDEQAHLVSVAGEVVKIRPLQFQLLSALARSAGSVISRDQLLREVWGIEPDGIDPRRLRITISGLRRILGSGPLRPSIESVARFGYRLTVPRAAA